VWCLSMSVESEKLRKERAKRLEIAIRGGRPDRVPYWSFVSYFAARYSGITYHEFDYDYEKNLQALIKVAQDFDFDALGTLGGGVGIIFPPVFVEEHFDLMPQLFLFFGTVHDILMDKYTKWAGRELGVNTPSQIAYIDMPYMKEDEYDEFAKDPVEFMSKKLIPRVFRSLSDPASPRAYGALIKLGIEIAKINQYTAKLMNEMIKLGYSQILSMPIFIGAPLDFIADVLRGHTYTMIDLYRRPEKVMKAIESVIDLNKKIIKKGKELWDRIPPEVKSLFDIQIPIQFIPLHLNEMLPPKFFKEFYWEPFKIIIDELVKTGAIVWIFYEGNFTPFLEYILELPKGKTISYFEKSDLRKAREVLGTHTVIMGGISAAHFIHGTPKKVFEEVCKLLNDVKEPGGFIYSGTGISIPNESKPENVKASIEAVKKCGVYP